MQDWGQLFRGEAQFWTFTHQSWIKWVEEKDTFGAWADWISYIKERYAF